MAWPDTRMTTYTPASPVKSNDLNALQDATIGGKHGTLTKWFPPGGARNETSITFDGGNGNFAASADNAVLDYIPIPLKAGTQIIGYKVRLLGVGFVGAGDPILNVRRWKGDGSADLLGQLVVNDPPAAWATYSFTLGAPVTTLDDQSFWWFFSFLKTGIKVSAFGLVIKRP